MEFNVYENSEMCYYGNNWAMKWNNNEIIGILIGFLFVLPTVI